MPAVVELQGVKRSFREGDRELEILRGVDLTVQAQELVAIVGPSGSGKTSLLNVIGALDGHFSGRARLFGQDLGALDDDGRAGLRNGAVGFIFQAFHLLEHLDVVENVMAPLWLRTDGLRREEELRLAREALDRVGLAARAEASVTSLSGGERQRVAVARALVNDPRLLLADEPTGNLDDDTAESIHALFDELRRDGERAVIIVTHDRAIAERADRVLTMTDGRLVEAT